MVSMWSDLSVRHLLALRAVVEEGTFGRAADRLGFSQSAVSQQVAALEAMVGQTLFDRPGGPRRPVLTAAGELLLEQSAAILSAVEEAEREVDRFARGVSGRLAVGTFQSISTRVLPAALRRLYEQAPGVEVTLIDGDVKTDVTSDPILSGELDLAFAVGEVGDAFDSVALGEDPHIAVVEAGYPAGPVDLRIAARSPMVGQPEDDSCGLLVDHQLERHGLTPRYAFRSHDNGAVQGMVAAGMGVALMPLLAVDTGDPATSIRTTVPELEPRLLSLVWAKGQALSPIAQRFVDIVSTVCADFLSQATDCQDASATVAD